MAWRGSWCWWLALASLALLCAVTSGVPSALVAAGRPTSARTRTRTSGPLPADVVDDLHTLLTNRSQHYNCSLSLGVQLGTGQVRVVAGEIDGQGTRTKDSDGFVWGSVTKVWTGALVLSLVDAGRLGLDDAVFGLIDDYWQAVGANATMEAYFGDGVRAVTVRHLLAMQSGIPDFDTAKPYPTPPTDPFRQSVYDHPTKNFTPLDMLSFSWVRTGRLLFPPGSKTSYSSSNFVLLGLLVCAVETKETGTPVLWADLDQLSVIPNELRDKGQYDEVAFARHGGPDQYTRVHGFDRTNYNNRTSPFDVYGVSGVFAGWTASDLVSSAGDAARFTYDIYGPDHKVLSAKIVQEMIPTGPFYGLATFNLSHTTGQNGTYGVAYGHLGATYGYDSIVVYFPGLEFSIAVGSNMESDYQEHPSDVICVTYNRIRNYLLDQPVETCEYQAKSYYSSGCVCKPPPSDGAVAV